MTIDDTMKTPGKKMADMTTMAEVSTPFKGDAVNGGMVVFTEKGKERAVTMSDDFRVPSTPAPHWRIVDRMGHVYLLNRLMIEGGKFNKTILLPAYITSVAKVQIWCAFAEVVLGEAIFEKRRM